VEEEEETEVHDNEDIELHWEDKEDDELYDEMPRASPPPSPTPTPPPCYKDEWVNEWINEEQDIINTFPRPPPFPLLLNANPHPLQSTATAE
jgi:hypothetical protein